MDSTATFRQAVTAPDHGWLLRATVYETDNMVFTMEKRVRASVDAVLLMLAQPDPTVFKKQVVELLDVAKDAAAECAIYSKAEAEQVGLDFREGEPSEQAAARVRGLGSN